MNKSIVIAATVAALMGASCQEKKKADNDIITTSYEAPQPKAPIAMGQQSTATPVEWAGGRQYVVEITRMPVDTLPMVADENGQEYIDNAIRLEVRRADSTLFFGRTFTKASFAAWLGADYQSKALLSGMSCLPPGGVDASLSFVAWLNYPQAVDDEALNLRLTLDAQGNVEVAPFTYDDRDDLVATGE